MNKRRAAVSHIVSGVFKTFLISNDEDEVEEEWVEEDDDDDDDEEEEFDVVEEDVGYFNIFLRFKY